MQASRRDVFTVASMLAADAAMRAAIAPTAAEPADERPKEGDYLVATDAANLDSLLPRDIAGPPVIAWPM
jgi:rieske iron-sulfur protein